MQERRKGFNMNQGVLFQVMNEGKTYDVYGIVNIDGDTYFVIYDEEASRFDIEEIKECSRI
jgi:hypothetical protein